MANLRVKVRQGSKGLTVFVSRVVRNGRIQRLFAEKIGHPTGQCVAQALRGQKGISGGKVHETARHCAPAKGTVHLR